MNFKKFCETIMPPPPAVPPQCVPHKKHARIHDPLEELLPFMPTDLIRLWREFMVPTYQLVLGKAWHPTKVLQYTNELIVLDEKTYTEKEYQVPETRPQWYYAADTPSQPPYIQQWIDANVERYKHRNTYLHSVIEI